MIKEEKFVRISVLIFLLYGLGLFIDYQSFVMYFFEILTFFGFFVSFLLAKKKFLLLLSIFSTFIFVDDFFNVHGKFGQALSENYALPVFVNLREVDTGEMLVWLSMGFLLTLLFPYSLRKLQIREQAFCAIYFCLFFSLINDATLNFFSVLFNFLFL